MKITVKCNACAGEPCLFTMNDENIESIEEFEIDEMACPVGCKAAWRVMAQPSKKPSKKQYFGVRFLAPEFEGRLGFSLCIDMKFMIKDNQLGILYLNSQGKTIHVLIQITGFKWIQNRTMDTVQTVILCDSWKIIKEKEL